ncbi:hypothetical protein, partial [Aliarcobacter butzleri]|uniref:hypothetical protein n=1 Tax=Aliarcobacter butzleri TaxID=28197 RepID=UPI0018695A55
DTTAVNKDLYSSSTGTKVDATLDTRLLTKDGRNQIKDDMYTASAILKSIEQIASNDKVSILDFFDETQQNVDIYNAMKRKIASDENFASKLQDPNLDPLAKQNMLQEIALTVMKELGYVPNDVKLIYTDETGANGVQVKGFYDPKTQTSYVNDKNNNSTNELVSSTGHEIMHDVDKQKGIFVSKDKDQNIYATNFGNNLAYYTNGALYIVNGGSLSSTNNHNNGVVTQYPSVFNTNNVLSGNNKEFANINKSGGDDWVVQVIGGSIGGGSNIYSQYKRNGDSLNLKNINWTELGINIGTGAWSGGASSLGGAIVRGGIASGINETYNQVKYNKNGIDYSEIGKYSTIGVVTGGSVGLAGNLGNKIIIPTGVIGRPVNEPIKTWKIPAEIGAGVSGAVVPNLKSNNDE